MHKVHFARMPEGVFFNAMDLTNLPRIEPTIKAGDRNRRGLSD